MDFLLFGDYFLIQNLTVSQNISLIHQQWVDYQGCNSASGILLSKAIHYNVLGSIEKRLS